MRRQLYRIIFILLMSFVSCKVQQPTNTINELDRRVNAIFSESELPGFSLVLVNDNKVLYQKSLGYSKVSSKELFTNNSVQNIASVSKTFLGVALMKAVDLGKLSLDDNINDYLPFKITHPKYPNTPIKILHLANHTSGINDGDVYRKSYLLKDPNKDYTYLPKEFQGYVNLMKNNKEIAVSEFLKNVLSTKGEWYSNENFTRNAPGIKYNYSNIGASLAAFIIENAVGMSYEKFTAKYIFEPLNMTNTKWNSSDYRPRNMVTKYLNKGLSIPDYYLITSADGGLITNTNDFAKYLIEMMKGSKNIGTLLSNSSYKTMFTRKEFVGDSSGIFWGISSTGNPNHYGSDPGVITMTSISKKKDIAVFFMTNLDLDANNGAMKSIIKILKAIKVHNWNNNK